MTTPHSTQPAGAAAAVPTTPPPSAGASSAPGSPTTAGATAPVWRAVIWGLYSLLLMQQLPVIFRQADFSESLLYYAVDDLIEYPTVAVWPIEVFKSLGWDSAGGFAALLVVVQALVVWACTRWGTKETAFLWLACISAMGPLMLSRMDLLPGALVAWALALVVRHPRTSGALLAVATGMKLWPGLVAAALLGSWRRVLAFVATGVALVAASIAVHGLDRTVSPLVYQGDRGIQVESLFATPLLLREGVTVEFANSMSFEVFGPGVQRLTGVADLAQLLVVLGAAVLGVVTARRWTGHTAVACATSIVWLIIATNKVFSPQYLLWVLPLMLVVVTTTTSKVAHVMAWACVPLTVMTTLIYPLMYPELLEQAFTPVMLLWVRNLMVLGLTVLSLVWWWQEWRAAPATPRRGATAPAPAPTPAPVEQAAL
ncbi:hypothetical protein C1Y63_11550 [Corynebacterium sp. 13CS0277]|uniref:glycosyltransferase family 87 protein n=1 Tax=Corynebacterium sp. 13CS0277 TaxID=2071994 RepID=UPI000D03DC11|nr:glycosyltransferase family 87 protein [Corynebacterium sp. 13CS0277]PRQ10431.1 hypothetical protein C1Y63_11550 [Corynebacterium sp. 13CS0277]